jgi:hypothetical protein
VSLGGWRLAWGRCLAVILPRLLWRFRPRSCPGSKGGRGQGHPGLAARVREGFQRGAPRSRGARSRPAARGHCGGGERGTATTPHPRWAKQRRIGLGGPSTCWASLVLQAERVPHRSFSPNSADQRRLLRNSAASVPRLPSVSAGELGAQVVELVRSLPHPDPPCSRRADLVDAPRLGGGADDILVLAATHADALTAACRWKGSPAPPTLGSARFPDRAHHDRAMGAWLPPRLWPWRPRPWTGVG